MHSFEQYMPTKIVFGKEAELKAGTLAKEWQAKKVLLVYGGGSVVRSGLLGRVEAVLKAEGIEVEELGGVKPNPRMSLAKEGVKKAINSGADLVMAVGGGSCIDTAKAIAIAAAKPGTDLEEFWSGKVPIEKALPVGVVLTIAAAGSEMSDSAVLTNEETGKKAGAHSDLVRPKFAMMNPELMYTLPKYQLTCGIVDIMMHTMERYFTPVDGNELTDEIAEGVLRTVIRNGLKAYEDQQNYDALSEIMWCGSLSHNGLTECGRGKDFSVHKFGHALSAKYDVAHGASLAAVWGAWAKYQYDEESVLWRFARFAEKVWGITEGSDHKRATEGIERTVAFFHSLGMPTSLHELDILNPSDEDLRALSMDATQQDTVKLSRIRKLGAQEVYEIYQMAR